MIKPTTYEEAMIKLGTINAAYHKLAGECQVIVNKKELEKIQMCEGCKWRQGDG